MFPLTYGVADSTCVRRSLLTTTFTGQRISISKSVFGIKKKSGVCYLLTGTALRCSLCRRLTVGDYLCRMLVVRCVIMQRASFMFCLCLCSYAVPACRRTVETTRMCRDYRPDGTSVNDHGLSLRSISELYPVALFWQCPFCP